MAFIIDDLDFQIENQDVGLDFNVPENEIGLEVETENEIDMEMDTVTQVTTSDHDKLQNRGKPDQHPIEAITDLSTILDGKTNAEDVLSNMDILKILER